MRFRDWSDKGTASDFVQISGKVRRRPYQWLDKRSGKKASAIRGCLNCMLGSGQTEKGETGKEQSQEHTHHFLWHQGRSFTNNLSWQVKQSILNTNVTTEIAWKCAETSPRTLMAKGLAVVSRQRTSSHFPFHQGIFYRKQHVVPHPRYFPLFLWLKTKLKSRHFVTTEVIEQNLRLCWTLTEHNFQDTLKNGRSSGTGAYVCKGVISRVMVACRLKVIFWQDRSTSPGNYGRLFVPSQQLNA
jgi:hypothetical protein